MHGGGPGSGRPVTHGKRSKFQLAEGRLGELLKEELEDPELLSHLENVAILGALKRRELEILLAQPDGHELWAEALKLYDQIKAGGEKAAEAFKKLGKLLREGSDGERRMERIRDLSKEQRKHKDSELRVIVAKETFITPREAALMVANLERAIKDEVEDPAQQRAIALRFAVYMRQSTSVEIDILGDGPPELPQAIGG